MNAHLLKFIVGLRHTQRIWKIIVITCLKSVAVLWGKCASLCLTAVLFKSCCFFSGDSCTLNSLYFDKDSFFFFPFSTQSTLCSYTPSPWEGFRNGSVQKTSKGSVILCLNLLFLFSMLYNQFSLLLQSCYTSLVRTLCSAGLLTL